MIDAKAEPPAAGFAARLTAKAEILAKARAESALRERRRDPWRWRKSHLLWPLFARG